jgi:hypothetical protein
MRAVLIAVALVVTASGLSTAEASVTETMPDVSSAAIPACRNGGALLSEIARDKEQGMSEVSAALNFFEHNRNFQRAGSHIPSRLDKKTADVLAHFVYAYPKMPRGAFFEIGTYHCEILRRIPPNHPNAGDVLPLLAINAYDCLAKFGDPAKDKSPKTVIDIYDNDAVDACVGCAAAAITKELLKP